jgi:hypothetical protein
MNKRLNKFSPEVRERAVRSTFPVLGGEQTHTQCSIGFETVERGMKATRHVGVNGVLL